MVGTQPTAKFELHWLKEEGSEDEASVQKICCKRNTENRNMIRSRNYFGFFVCLFELIINIKAASYAL